MKARTLIFCALLPTLLFISPCMTVQANEYREVNTEVKAEEILKNIENGNDIHLKNCRIIGELNLSRLRLETVPNQYFYKLLSEGYNKEDLIAYGLHENLSVIESNITIRNSTVESYLNFSNALFNNSVDFSYVNFLDPTDFSGTQFNDNVYFSGTQFNNNAYFSGIQFYDNIYFSNANFNSLADFSGTQFNNNVYFFRARFNDTAYFSGAQFTDSADFSETQFNDSADFSDTKVSKYKEIVAEEILKQIENGEEVNLVNCRIVGELNLSRLKLETTYNPYSYRLLKEGYDKEELISNGFHENSIAVESNVTIRNSVFENPIDFSNALFKHRVEFSYVTFNDFANFSCVNFNDSADFSQTNFTNFANFYGIEFNDAADFKGTKYNYPTDFSKTIFNNSAGFRGPDTSENIITDGKTSKFLREYYENEARYVDADNIYYNYRKSAMESESSMSSKLIDLLSWITCGYGIRLSHTIYCALFIIISFTFLYMNPEMSLLYWVIALQFVDAKFQILTPSEYNSINNESKNNEVSLKLCWKDPGIYRLPNTGEEKSILSSFLDALYFSIGTFTLVGSRDFDIKDNFKKYVTLEGLLGYIMLGILMATLSNILRISNI